MRAVHWFRSDLRLRDNAALAEAARGASELLCVFVLDDRLLASARAAAPRTRFLLDCVARLAADLVERGQRLVVRRGDPVEEIPRLLRETRAGLVAWNRDYGPYARRRDAAVARAAEAAGVRVVQRKDRVMFESGELRTGQGGAYRVYTPYRKAWWQRFRDAPPLPLGPQRLPPPVPGVAAGRLPSPRELDLAVDATAIPNGGEAAARRRLDAFLDGPVRDYRRDREHPARDGTSRLSAHLRFGTISVRVCVERALAVAHEDAAARRGVHGWVDELVWRDFYHGILDEHPRVLRRAFRPEFEAVRWNDDDEGFAAWCEGRTGYPIVDAGMRQLAHTGWMHNRVRMIAASFLAKDLLVDWRRGERFFMQRLVDGDPASNNGGWQWAASTGTDAQPFFRIFNPVSQGERFDPDGSYVRRFVPELADVPDRFVQRPWEGASPPAGYPRPRVDHAARRIEALLRYRAARAQAASARR